jgi:hypothetical protein
MTVNTPGGLCGSTIHDERGEPHPPATVSGTFVNRAMSGQPPQRIAYCPRCAAGLSWTGWFTPDSPALIEDATAELLARAERAENFSGEQGV